MSSRNGQEEGRLEWRTALIQGRPAAYGVSGTGPPMVFLHGWGLAHHSYRRALERVLNANVRVYAPALPGFGGTPDLPPDEHSVAGYARWVDAFITAMDINEPVTLVGHSFGGGVAIQTSYDVTYRVRRLILINSIGGSSWTDSRGVIRAISQRPLWDWGLHLRADIFPMRQLTRVLPVIAEDALPNLLRNPRAIWRVARLARTADLTAELEELKRRRLPVVIVWGQQDRLIPEASFAAIRAALGDPPCITVPGTHAWLLSDPHTFGEVITNVMSLPAIVDELTKGPNNRPVLPA